MKKYENFFDLFNINPAEDDEEHIKSRTTKKLKSLHPDKSEQNSIEVFKTAKIGRSILINTEKRKEYRKNGHNKYVKKNIDKELNGIVFSGGSSLSKEQYDKSFDDEDLEDIIRFDNQSSNNDPTVTAVKQTESENKVTGTQSDSDSAIEARKLWKDDDEKRKKEAGSITVKLFKVITHKYTKILILLSILFSIYIGTYIVLGGLSVIFLALFSVGVYYLFKNIF